MLVGWEHLVRSSTRWCGRVCGHGVEQLVRLTGGGMNETYRVELAAAVAVVVRIARQPVPWFIDEAHVMAQARAVGVPTPEVLGLEHVDHDGELLSFSIQRLLPGRSLDELAGELPACDLERLVMDGGELLARVHSVASRPRHPARAPAARRALPRPRGAHRRADARPGGGLGRRARCRLPAREI